MPRFERLLIPCVLLALGCSAKEKPPLPIPLPPFTQEVEGTFVQFDMVSVPGAKLVLPPGPEGGPKRELEIKSFYMGRTEVTLGLYSAFLTELRADLAAGEAHAATRATNVPPDPRNPKLNITLSHPSDVLERPRNEIGLGNAYPVCRLSHYNATKFCEWLSRKTGRKYRLPTELEWEYAARFGDPGDVNPEQLPGLAWFEDNAGGKPHPVGSLAANALGLHDMLGNVAEWCIGTDGKPVTRGGSFMTPANRVTYELRQGEQFWWNANDSRNPRGNWWLANGDFVGMRVVCEE